MVEAKQIHPRGVPVPRGPLAQAIAENNFLDYNWLKLKTVIFCVLSEGVGRNEI